MGPVFNFGFPFFSIIPSGTLLLPYGRQNIRFSPDRNVARDQTMLPYLAYNASLPTEMLQGIKQCPLTWPTTLLSRQKCCKGSNNAPLLGLQLLYFIIVSSLCRLWTTMDILPELWWISILIEPAS